MISNSTAAPIDAAVQALRAGELVAFPTETVYGLGADAMNPAALRQVFTLKGRPSHHPLIVHLADAAELPAWADAVPAAAARLAAQFWPGPLTLVLPRAGRVLPLVTGGQDTVAVRVPSHPLAQALLQAFGGALAAPSANRFGRLSPTSAAHVRAEFGAAVRIVLDGGECALGLESTIVACLDDRIRLLRPGLITRSQLEAVVGSALTGPEPGAPRVPGALPAHYAPLTPLALIPAARLEAEARRHAAAGRAVGVLALGPAPAPSPWIHWIEAGRDPAAYAHGLYGSLRRLDALGADCLLVQEPPDEESWEAARDRLRRAAAASVLPALALGT